MVRYGVGRARCLGRIPNSFTKELLIPPAIFLFFAGLPSGCRGCLPDSAGRDRLCGPATVVLAAGSGGRHGAEQLAGGEVLPGFYVAATIWLIHMGLGYGFLKTVAVLHLHRAAGVPTPIGPTEAVRTNQTNITQ